MEATTTQSFIDATKIQVVLLPVGEISEAKFREFAELISSFDTVDLRDLTRVAPAGHTTTWLAGTIRFKYIQVKAPLNDWDHIQAHRKVLAVIGIAHCPVSMNLKETYSAFVSASLQYNYALQRTCFAFEPLPTQADEPIGELVMIPNADKSKLNFYIQTLINDFAAQIVTSLEMEVCGRVSLKQPDYYFTPTDTPRTNDDKKLLQKRKPARYQKLKGDFCLLAGQPKEAVTQYVSP